MILTVAEYRSAMEDVRRLASEALLAERYELQVYLASSSRRRAKARQQAADLRAATITQLQSQLSDLYPDNRTEGPRRLAEATAERLGIKQ